ncbi:MAG TPA: hypothetical protein DEO38_00365 [Bacteroidales bacterium]|nr:hypothetical protein [Bacteroidales bacterium]
MALAHDLAAKQNCHQCQNVNRVIDEHAETLRAHHRREYNLLKINENYTDVQYDKKTGGVKATHIGHNEQPQLVYKKVTGTALELHCQNVFYRKGYR